MSKLKDRVRNAADQLGALQDAGQLAGEDEETLKVVRDELESVADQLDEDHQARNRSLVLAAIKKIGWLVLLRTIDSSDDYDL